MHLGGQLVLHLLDDLEQEVAVLAGDAPEEDQRLLEAWGRPQFLGKWKRKEGRSNLELFHCEIEGDGVLGREEGDVLGEGGIGDGLLRAEEQGHRHVLIVFDQRVLLQRASTVKCVKGLRNRTDSMWGACWMSSMSIMAARGTVTISVSLGTSLRGGFTGKESNRPGGSETVAVVVGTGYDLDGRVLDSLLLAPFQKLFQLFRSSSVKKKENK